MINLEEFNEQQKEAVVSEEKYLRVVAGAGSGKTKVLTSRIVYLMEEKKESPSQILAITFTNKAANEMRNRVFKMIGEMGHSPTICTVHSLGLKILRSESEFNDDFRNFGILDSKDQDNILEEIYETFGFYKQEIPYTSAKTFISNAKTKKQRAQELYSQNAKKKLVQIYEEYLKKQEKLYVYDFDDFIIKSVELLEKNEDFLKYWQEKFTHILVDEFQDIDKQQFQLIRLLVGEKNNLFVVGDPDQSIYTWRGAEVEIIDNLEEAYPSLKTVLLEQNYRSSKSILEVANQLIKNNKERIEKNLFTKKSGEKVQVNWFKNRKRECAFVAKKIINLHEKGVKYRDIAVLYRANYLSREVENQMDVYDIPYGIYGGYRFFDRMEIKDVLAFLRVIVLEDDLSLMRIINKPKRFIGKTTIEKGLELAGEEKISLFTALSKLETTEKTKKSIENFKAIILKWRELLQTQKIKFSEFTNGLLSDLGYFELLNYDGTGERKENIIEFFKDLDSFESEYPNESLFVYLEQVFLRSQKYDENVDKVKLMSVHSAKGLEFHTVFVVDMDDGVFPNKKALGGRKGKEEERRLAYVALTRSKEKLFISYTGFSSEFIDEIADNKHICKTIH
ncbi:ATP-dependent helicase [Bulleidia sp. zg-1006]|uniref:ATP-dependent helicase n=1 Tax=Bulleidia sp. zg-1006 TaxID=2806552 RepID=UPI001939A94E|nr:UvrD-helicase domain-containing protein [Bulleidia sp. zg-1006]QRG86084.1 UvrD-helicase domain-containing protein [Bulleidia sp. zg-1006]